MLVDENKRFLISSFCSSTSNCTLQHCYLCPSRLAANHLFEEDIINDPFFVPTGPSVKVNWVAHLYVLRNTNLGGIDRSIIVSGI